jgi:hypothetical protein|tara:strand:+ start:5436 stop:6053 length:618 start_codon:yes stop_codon:yes gene_type:complete
MYGMKKEYGMPEYGQPEAPMGAEQPMADPAAQGQAPADPQAEMEQQFEQMAQSAPQPEKPFTVKVIQGMVKTLNATMSKLTDEDIPEITFDPEDAKGGKYDQSLPGELFVMLVAITQLLQMVGGGEFADKYDFDPYTAVTDTDIRKITAQLQRIGKDKKLIEAIKEMTEGEDMTQGEEPMADEPQMQSPPDAMSGEDEELASAMA